MLSNQMGLVFSFLEVERAQLLQALESKSRHLYQLADKSGKVIFQVRTGTCGYDVRMWEVWDVVVRTTKEEVLADFDAIMAHEHPPNIRKGLPSAAWLWPYPFYETRWESP